MTITVERIRFSEIRVIRHLYRSSSEKLKQDFNSPTIFTNRKWLLFTYLSHTPIRKILPARVHVFVAKSGGEIVGFCYITEKGNQRNLGIMVKEGYQGKGIGDKLMNTALVGMEDVTLSVMYSNERAKSLYRKYGFKTENVIEYMRKK